MNKKRQRSLRKQFLVKFGRTPNRTSSEHTSEWRALKGAWKAYVAHRGAQSA